MYPDWTRIHTHIFELEQRGLVTRTFRRLDPERQQAILSAILEEAAARDPAALNIKQVAARAGVAVGSLYQYFGDRDGLLAFAIALVTQVTIDSFVAYRPALLALPLRQALATFIGGGLEWGQQEAGFVQFFSRAAYHGDPRLAESVVRPIATVMRQLLTDLLLKAAERGELRPGIDLEATARLLHAWSIAVIDPILLPYLNTYFQVLDAGMTPERLVEALMTLAMRALTPEETLP